MKQFKDLTEIRETLNESQPDPPAILILRRQYIRMFPGNVKVAVYWSDKLKKHITVPYEDIQFSVQEAAKPASKKKEPQPFDTDNMAIIKNIVTKSKPDTLEFSDGSTMDVDVDDANAILSTYARLTPENKKKVEEYLTKGVGGLMKLIKFCNQQ